MSSVAQVSGGGGRGGGEEVGEGGRSRDEGWRWRVGGRKGKEKRGRGWEGREGGEGQKVLFL